MNPVGPWPALLCLISGLLAAMLLVNRFGKPPPQGRFLPIDGLRGYLAFAVFIHHACVWYYYMHKGDWAVPPSNFYTHLGQSSVAVFFMITGFLFFSKLIDGRKKQLDWGRLYVSRVLRLTPLYVFAMCLLFLIVAIRSRHGLLLPLKQEVMDAARWLSFTIFGSPLLNGVRDTRTVTAAVTWTLPYEWFFYLSLPLLFLLVGRIPPFFYFALALFSLGFLLLLMNMDDIYSLDFFYPEFWKAAPFLGGMAAAALARSGRVRRMAGSWIASFVAIACLLGLLWYATAYYAWGPVLLLSVAFAIVACGNDFFGILIHPVSRILGEISYSIYLLHGIILYVTFHFIMGEARAASWSSTEYWLVAMGIAPVVVWFSFATFRFIEKPAMDKTPVVSKWVNKQIQPVLDFGQKIRERIYSKGRRGALVVLKNASEK
ncbi:MAG TPA: acyltransferase [Verrucomicrobiae bacterium]|nr:acyltransferase [Verrucomicrobiae bacterium]